MSVSINCFYCPMKNSRKIDSPKRSIIDNKKKRLVNSDSHDYENSDVLVSAVISPYLLIDKSLSASFISFAEASAILLASKQRTFLSFAKFAACDTLPS